LLGVATRCLELDVLAILGEDGGALEAEAIVDRREMFGAGL
jgi:hypothetical protein